MTDLRDRVADGVRAAMGEAWDDATEYVYLPAVAARHLPPIIAAHEAEVVGRILDRIDALHQSEDVPTSQHYYCEPYECDRAGEGGMEPICTECRVEHPCPTRRLTAEIRGELSHA